MHCRLEHVVLDVSSPPLYTDTLAVNSTLDEQVDAVQRRARSGRDGAGEVARELRDAAGLAACMQPRERRGEGGGARAEEVVGRLRVRDIEGGEGGERGEGEQVAKGRLLVRPIALGYVGQAY